MRLFVLKFLPLYGIIFFLLFNVIAMFFYPGGSIYNPDTNHYDFFKNYLSQLGRLRAINGESNTISSCIWMSGMTITGIIFFIYYIYLPTFFKNKISIFASIFGCISCISFILTGLTPGDLIINFSHFSKPDISIKTIQVFYVHKFFANNIFYFGLISALIYSYLIYKSKQVKSRYGLGYYIFSIIVLIYVFILIYGPDPFGSENDLIFHVTAQKIVAISWVLSTFILSLGIRKKFNE
tara:strand:+ start:827 stop:1540 length:714 start_codon:yes stop_codon:yes gene_type:complete